MHRPNRLDPEAHHPSVYYSRRRRSRSSRAMRRLALPIVAAVLFAMVAIPLLSIGLVGDAGVTRGARASDDLQLVELDRLPARSGYEESEIRSLKEWLREHFSEEEIDEMRERFVDGRDPDQVRAEVAELAESVSRGVYVDVPRYFADRLSERLGRERTKDLKGHLVRIEPAPEELEELAVEELFPERR